MTHEARGLDRGSTVAFFFSTGISSDGEDIILSHSPTLPIHSPSPRLTPPLSNFPPFPKNSQFFTKHQKPQQSQSFPI